MSMFQKKCKKNPTKLDETTTFIEICGYNFCLCVRLIRQRKLWMARTAVSPLKRLGSCGTASVSSSSCSREGSSSVSTSSTWWLSYKLQPSKPPGKTWTRGPLNVSVLSFHGFFFLGGGSAVAFLEEGSSATPHLYHIHVCVCVCLCNEALFPHPGGLNSSKPVLWRTWKSTIKRRRNLCLSSKDRKCSNTQLLCYSGLVSLDICWLAPSKALWCGWGHGSRSEKVTSPVLIQPAAEINLLPKVPRADLPSPATNGLGTSPPKNTG